MKTNRPFLIFFLLICSYFFCQNQKYVFECKASFLPSKERIDTKYLLSKKESKIIYNILNSDSIIIKLTEEDLKLLKSISAKLKLNCAEEVSKIFASQIIKVPKQLVYDNKYKLLDELIVIDGVPFELSLHENNLKTTQIKYKDNLYNSPYFTKFENYYLFYTVLNLLEKPKLKFFEQYFNKTHLFKVILVYYADNNCR